MMGNGEAAPAGSERVGFHAVLLAAGRGSRMGPLTRNRPKVLLPVAGRPMIHHLLDSAAAAGADRFTIIVHFMADQVRASIGDTWSNLPVQYVDQDDPRGTGHAVASLAGHVDGDFLLLSGDAFVPANDIAALLQASGWAVGTHHVADGSAYGVLDVDDGQVQGLLEKPDDAGAAWINAGMYRFDAGIIAECAALQPSPRGELELTDAIQARIDHGDRPRAVALDGWLEAGRPWDLLDMQAACGATNERRGGIDEQATLLGDVHVAEGARILGASRIEGPAWIGPDAVIGPNAYLRGPVSIGAGCHIGNSCEIKNSIIQDGSNVPHLSYVGDSVIGTGCNLGAGTQVANLKVNDRPVRVHWNGEHWVDTGRRKLGVIMGDDVKTGVNTSIHPGTVLDEGFLAPAGVVLDGWNSVE